MALAIRELSCNMYNTCTSPAHKNLGSCNDNIMGVQVTTFKKESPREKMRLMYALVVVIGFILAPAFAQAAIFECRTPASPIEKKICSNTDLLQQDRLITDRYHTAMSRLSAQGKNVLKNGQEEWSRFVRDLIHHANGSGESDDLFWLRKQFTERADALDTAAISVGPFVFSRTDHYNVTAFDENGRPFVVHAAAPRVDSPISPNVMQWNNAMAALAKEKANSNTACDGGPGDDYFDYEIVSATRAVISIRTSIFNYCHGAAHGYGLTHGISYRVDRDLHKLTTTDLFVAGSDWKKFVTKWCYTVLKKKAGSAGSGKEQQEEIRVADVEDVATNIDAWTLGTDGLHVIFSPWSVATGYAFGETEIVIPWADLRPYLVVDAPIPRASDH
jgi:uncharacterized protein YecT (DUF1311 family)